MPRTPRSQLPDGVFQITTRAVAGDVLYRDEVDRRRFIHRLFWVARECEWQVDTFCLMTTHYHLLVEALRVDLSHGMRLLNGHHARTFNIRHGRHGHVFGGRYAAWLVESEEHLVATRRYILLNPVRAGLCRAADDWPWSGSRHGRDLG
jgi:REP element-mobilizing transposase RayT